MNTTRSAGKRLVILCCVLIFSLVSVFAQGKEKREFYHLTVYHYTNAEQEKVLDQYLEKAYLPALHRLKLSKIGVFKPIQNDTATDKRIYVLLPYSSLDALIKLPASLASDKAYQQAAADYIDAKHTSAPYQRMESILLQAFSRAPKMQQPNLKGSKENRVYELRSYESATEKIFANKVRMFNEGDEIGIFQNLEFNAIFYGEVIAGSKMPNLMYMTSFEDIEDRNNHWKAFSADADWKKLSSLPEYQQNVSHIDIVLMNAAPYSDY